MGFRVGELRVGEIARGGELGEESWERRDGGADALLGLLRAEVIMSFEG